VLISAPADELRRPCAKSAWGDQPVVDLVVQTMDEAKNLVNEEGDIPRTPVTLLAIAVHLLIQSQVKPTMRHQMLLHLLANILGSIITRCSVPVLTKQVWLVAEFDGFELYVGIYNLGGSEGFGD
jgi:hypothetical protein